MTKKLSEFWGDETGGSPFAEYGLIAGIVSMAGMVSWTFIGGSLRSYFTDLSSSLGNIASSI